MFKHLHYNPIELIWFGAVVVLLFIACIGGSAASARPLIPQTSFADNTPLLTVRTPASLSSDSHYIARLFSAHDGVTSVEIPVSAPILDLTGSISTWQRFLMRFWKTYAVSTLHQRPTVLLGEAVGTVGVYTDSSLTRSQSPTLPAGVSIAHLPASLLTWSMTHEPIQALHDAEREVLASGQGLYGDPQSPQTILSLPPQQDSQSLKLLSGLLAPRTRLLPLGDGTSAHEIIADTEALSLQSVPSQLGDLLRVSSGSDQVLSQDVSAAELSTPDVTLLFSDSSVAQEHTADQAFDTLKGCPLVRVITYVRQPFFALGWDMRDHFTFCTE